MINVSKLKEGIVIDHIDEGRGYYIYKELKLNQIKDPVVLMQNIPSRKMGKKDLIKIETDLDLDLNALGLINPNATINIVKNGELIRKFKLTLPEKVSGLLVCKNPRCITRSEYVPSIDFYLVNEANKTYRCEYCDTYTTYLEK